MLTARYQQALARPAPRRSAAAGKQQQPARIVVARGEGQESNANAPESFQESSGFVAYDSAGQSNMYPVRTPAYASDKTDDATTGIALGAGAVAIGVIAIGVVALGGSGSSEVDITQFKALSEYAAAFSADL